MSTTDLADQYLKINPELVDARSSAGSSGPRFTGRGFERAVVGLSGGVDSSVVDVPLRAGARAGKRAGRDHAL